MAPLPPTTEALIESEKAFCFVVCFDKTSISFKSNLFSVFSSPSMVIKVFEVFLVSDIATEPLTTPPLPDLVEALISSLPSDFNNNLEAKISTILLIKVLVFKEELDLAITAPPAIKPPR
ncbi:MAG: hypothetical protein BWY78_00735 [Alphaproteobacteria bacterium ADurb.Bin438]|nr:MAG: hypothetical protein BWY78_00735 [Alphaproteobacteria bacterium ADurb.Bin438]